MALREQQCAASMPDLVLSWLAWRGQHACQGKVARHLCLAPVCQCGASNLT